MRTCLFATFILVAILGTCFAEETPLSRQIDFKSERKVDVTGDGIPDIVTLNVFGKNITSPFTWEISISSNGNVFYSVKRSDKDIDHLFNDIDFVGECSDYYSCKKKWYFNDLINNIIVPEAAYNLNGILDSKYPNGLFAVGIKYLNKNYGIHRDKANTIINSSAERLKKHISVVISIPISPVKGDSPMVFVPEVGSFMPIYEE